MKDVIEFKKKNLIKKYNSRFSYKSHDYLKEMVEQIKKPHEKKGFWDDSHKNWIMQLNWNGSGWSGFVKHDWRYATSCQEGALIYAMQTKGHELDSHIKDEFHFIHKQINGNGSIKDLPDNDKDDYGIVLSVLGLGYCYLHKTEKKLAQQVYKDMTSVLGYIKLKWEAPRIDDKYSIILRGLVNAYKAMDLNADKMKSAVKKMIEGYVKLFISNQRSDGSWDVVGVSSVQKQMKRDIAILLSYDVTRDPLHLRHVNDNVSFIIESRWDSKTGGVKWTSSDPNFFECHQLWFMIVLNYIYEKSGKKYDYRPEIEKVWKFLTEENYAGVDMYVHNKIKYGTFFSYRVINNNANTGKLGAYFNKFLSRSGLIGKPFGMVFSYNGYLGRMWDSLNPSKKNRYIQPNPYGGFKGNYEIGTALWGMALNYDLI